MRASQRCSNARQAVLEFLDQGRASEIGTPTIHAGDHLAPRSVKAVPGPTLLLLCAHKRPEFIEFEHLNLFGQNWLFNLGRDFTQGFEHGVHTQAQHPSNVADA